MTQSDGWCPNGSEQQSPAPLACTISIDLASAGALAVIFPLGIPAEIADLVAGVAWGSIVAANLCSMPPADPGPFPVQALIAAVFGSEGLLLTWIAQSLERYWWLACCQCKAPPVPIGEVIANWSFSNWSGGALYVQPNNPAFGFASVLWLAGTVTNVEAAGTGYWVGQVLHLTPTTPHTCPNGTSASNSVNQTAWGPGSAASPGTVNGTYGQRLVGTGRYTTVSSQDCIGVAMVKQGTTAAHISGNLQLYQQLTDPETYPPTAFPPATQPVAPGGGASGSPIYGAPNEGVAACSFAPIAANWIERSLAPRSRVVDGAVRHISGAGVLAIPAGAIGWTVTLTAYPPAYSHDAGDPPQLYQVGWMATSIDGVELSSAQQNIRSGQEQFWFIKPTDAYIAFNLFPGYTADVQFWNTSTPN